MLWRISLVAARSRGKHWSRPAYESLLRAAASTESLFVDGANWGPGAAFVREWFALAATALVWRLRDGKLSFPTRRSRRVLDSGRSSSAGR